jgi:hypothetical protein
MHPSMLSDMLFTNNLGLVMRSGSKCRIWICFQKVNHGRRAECLGAPGAPIVSGGAGTAATKVEAKHRIAVQMVSFIIVCDKKLGPKKDIVVYI